MLREIEGLVKCFLKNYAQLYSHLSVNLSVIPNLAVQKPPSGGPRSPCICVANTARAGAAGLARASKQSGDGRTIRAISRGSVEYCNILIMSAKSIVRYYSVYLQNSKFLRNFLRKFKCRVSYYGCKILLRRESK